MTISPVTEAGPSLARSLDPAKIGPVGATRRRGLLLGALCLLLSVPAGYALARYPTPFEEGFFFLLLASR